MDGISFDRLSRGFVGTSSRRRLLALLPTLPLATRLAIVADAAARDAKTRRHRAQHQRRHSTAHRGNEQRREAHSEACIPTGQRCPSRKPRGKVGRRLSCAHCCQLVVVTDARGKRVCGCQPDGTSCTPDTASACCSGVCTGGACGGARCPACSGTTPVCQRDACAACTTSSQCPVNTICDPSGACLGCDVCQSGVCDFTSVQAAIDAMPQRDTIRVCAGVYVENAESLTAVHITRTLRLIGAGDGADPATNTILRPDHPDQGVMRVQLVGSPLTVSLERLRLTGATGVGVGRGLQIISAVVTLDTCTITDNHNAPPGAGISVGGSAATQVKLINTQITGNSNAAQGGGIQFTSGWLSLDERSRVTNNSSSPSGQSGGGIGAFNAIVDLASIANVTDNHPNNCSGSGTFTGPGSVCTMT